MMLEPSPGTSTLEVGPSAALRQRAAAAWVSARPSDATVLVVAPTVEAGSRILRQAAAGRPAAFGWQRVTLSELAARLASAGLAAAARAQAAPVVLEGLTARLVHQLRAEGALGRYARVGDQPGLPRALARTFAELALAGVSDDATAGDLGRLYRAHRRALAEAGLADRADVLRAAIDRARDPAPHPLLDHPTLFFDVPLAHALEGALLEALAARGEVRAIVAAGDRVTIRRAQAALRAEPTALPAPEPADALARLRAQLFADVEHAAPLDESVELFSAPSESRECVEILRRVRHAAADGVPFDRMAILVHAPDRYRAHLVEACRRADVPAHFARGTVRPDPAGRALLALLACKVEHLSARAFAEYLSLGVVPDADPDGAPPLALDVAWLPPDDELLPLPEPEAPIVVDEDDDGLDPDAPVVRGTLRAPWRWERLIVDAAVIGGADRWRRRVDALGRGFAAQLAGLEDPDDPRRARIAQRVHDLAHLARFALPLLAMLEALPDRATWGAWAEALDALARRAIRKPERVLAVLRELAPMAPIGPVGLTEVSLVLGERLSEMVRAPSGAPAGKLYVASTREARGLSFDVVFVPGLSERVFPKKVSEDPIALDAVRAALSPELATRETRVGDERLALRLAIGAAERRVVISHPRLDTGRGRPMVPSFYGLEVLRAVEGTLPSFEELAARAEAAGGARMAWPAPEDPEEAIDAAEYDLAVLAEHLGADDVTGAQGAARYLMDVSPHLARALRTRHLRWAEKWSKADGLVNPSPAAKGHLAPHAPDQRPYSATALQAIAACPYRFYLRAILGLSPREVPEPLEELDPLVRGQLVHEAQRVALERLRAEDLLPVTIERLPRAQELVRAAIDEVAARFAEELAPAIERVWEDAIRDLRSDLSEWTLRMAERPDWVPLRFELAFGLPKDGGHDPASVEAPVRLEEGLVLRGSIDLVEQRDGALRATDFKTGAAPAGGGVIRGGKVLQPVLYARALATLFPDRPVVGGRLYYCTSKGRFEERVVPIEVASEPVRAVAELVGSSIEQGFLPAAPDHGECARCDYRPICGPSEERRVARKHVKPLGRLRALRKRP